MEAQIIICLEYKPRIQAKIHEKALLTYERYYPRANGRGLVRVLRPGVVNKCTVVSLKRRQLVAWSMPPASIICANRQTSIIVEKSPA
jgi:hypothetical protein